MATRQKTVTYTFLTLASLSSSGTPTNLTQTTIWLPESSLDFVSVIARISCDDIATAAYNTISTKTFGLRLGAAAYTTVSNANAMTYTGENLSPFWIADFSDHFRANWTAQASGGAATCDFQIALLQTGGGGVTPGFVNVSVILDITYNYDDTSATQIKTVLIPLTSPAGTIATVATTYDTIPALDTYLAEASKTYRNIAVVVQGNTQQNAATTDHTLTLRVGATSVTTGNYEGSLSSDRFFRYVWALKYAAVNNWPSTSATQTWQPTGTQARVNHFQAYIIVTYEFTVSSTVTATNSVLLPMAVDAPAWGSGINNIYQRMTKDFYIAEPNPIAFSRVGYYFFFDTAAAVSSMGARLFTDTSTSSAYTVYTDGVATECGCDAASVTTTTFVLSRGKNNLSCDIYVADLIDIVPNISGFWMLNYTSGIASTGIGSHNNTRYKVIDDGFGTAVADLTQKTTVSTATTIIESSYYLNSFGIEYLNFNSSNSQMLALNIKAERLTEDGGIGWVMPYNTGIQMDPEAGARYFYAEAKEWFKQWPGDVRLYQNYSLLNPVTRRRWWVITAAYAAASMSFFGGFTLIYTAHGITFPVAGTITGSSGGTVNIELFNSAGEQLVTTTRVGDGTFSFDWYDDTENVQVVAYESSTNKGASALQVAGALNTFNIDLGSTYYAYA